MFRFLALFLIIPSIVFGGYFCADVSVDPVVLHPELTTRADCINAGYGWKFSPDEDANSAYDISVGGTNATTAAGARTALGITPVNIGAEPTQTAASQAEAEAGTEAAIRSFSPLRIFQAIAAKVAAMFTNKASLDKISESAGSPTWDGGAWPGGTGAVDSVDGQTGVVDLSGVYDAMGTAAAQRAEHEIAYPHELIGTIPGYVDDHIVDATNPHQVTAAQIGAEPADPTIVKEAELAALETDPVASAALITHVSNHPAPTVRDTRNATAEQGNLADTAVQPGDLAPVATSGSYADLTGQPTIPVLSTFYVDSYDSICNGSTNTLTSAGYTLESAQTKWPNAGITNITTDYVDWAAIKQAVYEAEQASGTVVLPGGTCYLSGEVVITKADIYGQGMGSTVVTGAHNGRYFTVTGDRVTLSGFSVMPSGTPTAGQIGIYLGKTDFSTLTQGTLVQNIAFENNYVGLEWGSATSSRVSSCLFKKNLQYSIKVDNDYDADQGDNAISDSHFTDNPPVSYAHVFINQGSGLRITNNKFIFGNRGIVAEVSDSNSWQSVLTIYGNSFEHQISGAVNVVVTDADTPYYRVALLGNEFLASGDPATTHFVQMQKVVELNASDNQMAGTVTTVGFDLNNVQDFSLSDNVLKTLATGIDVDSASSGYIGPQVYSGVTTPIVNTSSDVAVLFDSTYKTQISTVSGLQAALDAKPDVYFGYADTTALETAKPCAGNIRDFAMTTDGLWYGCNGTSWMQIGSGGGIVGDVPEAPVISDAAETTATTAAITLSTASTDVEDGTITSYAIYVDGNINGGLRTGWTQGTDQQVTGLLPTTNYNITVKARDSDSNYSTASNTVNITTLDGLHPPLGLNSTPESGQVALAWDAVASATAYDIEVSTDGTNYSILASDVGTNSYDHTSLGTDITWWYRVRSKDAVDTSAYSASVKQPRVAVFASSVDAGFTATTAGSGSVTPGAGYIDMLIAGSGDKAIVAFDATLPTDNKWTIEVDFTPGTATQTTGADALRLLDILSSSTVPSASSLSGTSVSMYSPVLTSNANTVVYFTPEVAANYWTGSSWETGAGSTVTLTPGTMYTARLISTATTIKYQVLNGETVLVNTGTVNWSSIRSVTTNRWFAIGSTAGVGYVDNAYRFHRVHFERNP